MLCPCLNKDGSPCKNEATKTGKCKPHSRKGKGGRPKKEEVIAKERDKQSWLLLDICEEAGRMLRLTSEKYGRMTATRQVYPRFHQERDNLLAALNLLRAEHAKVEANLREVYKKDRDKAMKRDKDEPLYK